MYPKKPKINQIKTPKKSNNNPQKAPINPFNKTTTTRKIVYQNRPSPIRKQIDIRQRLGSRSIQLQQSYMVKSDMRSEELFQHQNQQQTQLFEKSNRKLAAIKDLFGSNKTIELQLCQVLKLIKQEKTKIYETINDLKDVSDYYKNLAENKQAQKVQNSCNTQQIIPLGKDTILVDSQMQTEFQLIQQKQSQIIEKQSKTHPSQNEFLNQQSQPLVQNQFQQNKQIKNTLDYATQTQQQYQNMNFKDKKNFKQKIPSQFLTESFNFPTQRQNQCVSSTLFKKEFETYQKLAGMLSDMNINYKNILPENIKIEIPVKNWKQLSDSQIIKIQKYFIKKLAQKITN